MEDQNSDDHLMEESDVDEVQTHKNDKPKWGNGQCVLAIPSCSLLNPTFDLSLCSTTLERNGFQIPMTEIEVPLKTALEVPSVKRYMIFNSSFFHILMSPFLYIVLWCAVFSTLRLYMTISDYWILCLCVSLISIFLTTAIIFVLHHNKKEININLDVRLIQVNEMMVKHKLLVAVADWVHNCKGSIQSKLKKKMSHLVLMTEIMCKDPKGHSNEEQGPQEERPLLRNEECGSSSSSKFTTNYSLIPEASLPAQIQAHQLLMIYSAAYVKLLVSDRLSGRSYHHMRPQSNHCTTAPFCLCQYIKLKILE
ncbi:transmembrane protein 268 isoform X2 [Stigmatopora nigra]